MSDSDKENNINLTAQPEKRKLHKAGIRCRSGFLSKLTGLGLDSYELRENLIRMGSLGDGIQLEGRFRFDGDVPERFEEHARRSIPLYEEGHELILKISDTFIGENSLIYDLGCSTGRLLHLLAMRHEARNVRCTGVEREEAMIQYAQKNHAHPAIEYAVADVLEYDLGQERADMIICYYTVQFVRPAVRQTLINRIFEALRWGGAFLLFEKTRGPDARFQDLLTGLYNDFKLDRGYQAAEILRKSQSLRGFLEPFSTQGNFDLLARAGFQDYMTIMKYICFEGIIAIK